MKTSIFLLMIVSLCAVGYSAPPIDVAHSPAPLFDDPTWHGASDPFVIWNPVKNAWFMYYTQRRATLENAHGTDWVHGSAIGIAQSTDGAHWDYLDTCQGDHDLSDPMKATGAGPEPGITWWAPCFLYEDKTFHMWVTRVDGVYTNWSGKRNIVHFTSDDGVQWKYADTCNLASERVIDPTVYKVNDRWYMVYKNEAAGSNTFRSESTDLKEWTNPVQVTRDGSQEAPFVFRWKNQWWMIVDGIAHKSLRIYKSENGLDGWQFAADILNDTGTRPSDQGMGHHPGIVIQPTADGEQCVVFYFTHQGKRTVMQVAEVEMSANGKLTCNRNKYAPTTAPSATTR